MIPSLIRTYSPLVVAYLVGWLASLGISVDTETQGLITTAIGTVAAALYYALVRVLEKRFPALSVLLGSTKQPAVYAKVSADGKVPTTLSADLSGYHMKDNTFTGTVTTQPAEPAQPAEPSPPADPPAKS